MLAEIESITRMGMDGDIPFSESLARRLAIARPTREGLAQLGRELAGELTDGAEGLIARAFARGHEVWLVSGAFREVLLPAA